MISVYCYTPLKLASQPLKRRRVDAKEIRDFLDGEFLSPQLRIIHMSFLGHDDRNDHSDSPLPMALCNDIRQANIPVFIGSRSCTCGMIQLLLGTRTDIGIVNTSTTARIAHTNIKSMLS